MPWKSEITMMAECFESTAARAASLKSDITHDPALSPSLAPSSPSPLTAASLL
jgi:hypothetical protein